MSIKSEELKPCPFCGSEPSFPATVFGTYYEAGCSECGVASISLQIVDCFEHRGSPNRDDLHNSWDADELKYGDEFIAVARNEAITRWNTRAIPDTHQIMPVRLTDKMIEAALPELMREDDEDKYRALGQLICVWDALVEAAKEEGK